jgi:hypothetical protein
MRIVCVLIIFALMFTEMARAETLTDEQARAVHALSLIYDGGPFTNPFSISGTLTLPTVSANASWYTNWLAVVTPPDRITGNASMWQVGLIRWTSGNFRLEAFTAERPGQGAFVFHSLGAVPEGSHRVELAAKGGELEFLLDEKVVATESESRIFGASPIYLQMGHEVSAITDRAEGTISSIKILRSDGSSPAINEHTCRYEDRGIRFELKSDDSVEAVGEFDPSLPSKQLGDCRWFRAFLNP